MAGQVALSMLLLVGAGLFARSLFRLLTVDTGIETSHLLSFSIDPSLHKYTPTGHGVSFWICKIADRKSVV